MLMPVGKTRWALPETYASPGSAVQGHETISIFNGAALEARVFVTIYSKGRAPTVPHMLLGPPHRTIHTQIDQLIDPASIEPGRKYLCLFESDMPIVVRHTTIDQMADDAAPLRRIA